MGIQLYKKNMLSKFFQKFFVCGAAETPKYVENLPEEVLCHIFSYLDDISLMSVVCVNHAWHYSCMRDLTLRTRMRNYKEDMRAADLKKYLDSSPSLTLQIFGEVFSLTFWFREKEQDKNRCRLYFRITEKPSTVPFIEFGEPLDATGVIYRYTANGPQKVNIPKNKIFPVRFYES